MDDFQDALDKVYDAMRPAPKALSKAWGDLDKIKGNLEVTVRGYRNILSGDNVQDDKSAEKDFDACFAYGNRQLESIRRGADVLKDDVSSGPTRALAGFPEKLPASPGHHATSPPN
jgi:hypothetical protein